MITDTKIVGGSFVIEDLDATDMMTPEEFTEEHRMIAEMTSDFIENEVFPHDEEIEKLDYDLTVKLLRKAADLGLLSADVPEEYGGLGLDKISSTIIAEKLSPASSFALSLGAHTGIGTLPIVYFGSNEQKQKYLPDLASGAKLAAYCLTEPTSGSDALSAKTTAHLSEDGQYYIMNGSKQFITNAGFADIFIVYAKIDGEHFSAFIVERDMPGLTIGPEEKKMGIKGSSTRPLFFEDMKVPVENLLGEVGKGHHIAFNILNIGRFKLGCGCVGAGKEALEISVKYANTRKQFGTPISSFPLIGKKLAEMNIMNYVTESLVYRTAGLIEEGLKDIDHTSPDAGQQSVKRIAEYALECSINKVFASEALDFIVDEGVQVHGGYGFIQEYKIERAYRDNRINRIFEGTNEVNRLLIPGTLLKKAMKGDLPLMQKLGALQNELMGPIPAQTDDSTLAKEKHTLDMAKKIFLMVGGIAVQKYGMNLEKNQEVLSHLGDMMIQIFALESAYLRTQKLISLNGEDKAQNAIQMTEVFAHEAQAKIEGWAKEILSSIESGDVLRTQLSILKKLTKSTPVNTIEIKRQIAARVIQVEKYVI